MIDCLIFCIFSQLRKSCFLNVSIIIFQCDLSSIMYDPIYWGLSHRSVHRFYFFLKQKPHCSFWNTSWLNVLVTEAPANREPSFKVTQISSFLLIRTLPALRFSTVNNTEPDWMFIAKFQYGVHLCRSICIRYLNTLIYSRFSFFSPSAATIEILSSNNPSASKLCFY